MYKLEDIVGRINIDLLNWAHKVVSVLLNLETGAQVVLGSLRTRVFERGRQTEENISRARTVVCPRLLN